MELLGVSEGSTVNLEKILLIAEGNSVTVGRPTITGAKVLATSQGEIKGEKLIVFKRKRVELEREMEKIFDKIDGSYEYLLNIKTYQYTDEAIQSIREETSKSRIELDTLQQMSHIDMWKRDLKIYKQ